MCSIEVKMCRKTSNFACTKANPKSETLSYQLTWSHYFKLLKCDDPLEMVCRQMIRAVTLPYS